MANHNERRALARGRGPRVLAGAQFSLGLDEIGLLEEALHDYVRKVRAEIAQADNPTPVQTWACTRAERLRQAMEATLADRAWVDAAPDRQPALTP